ncbi:hypothetical protein HanRHA438_Chr00c67g0861241 [Helianthus annuus]|nr:hypothetical protein HanRHA438_Chr00c67g0861241 [Helianthus annuus]
MTSMTKPKVWSMHERTSTRTHKGRNKCFGPGKARCVNLFTGRSAVQGSTMILPQVHLRKPCYEFSFL